MLESEGLFAGLTSRDLTVMKGPFFGSFLSVTSEQNSNLQPAQKELLLLHQRLGHINLQWCQKLCAKPHDSSRAPIISTKLSRVSSYDHPICASCQLAKQTRRSPPSFSQGQPPAMILRQNHLLPGETVSIDQYLSSQPGRALHTKEKESKKNKYVGGTIFVDHCSSFVHLTHQVGLRAGETIRSKQGFENFAHTFGVRIKEYHADNVPFNSAAFNQHLQDRDQAIKFSGVGAYHQNGVAERAIQTITRMARSMLLNATLLWPDQANLELWPFAMIHAVYLWNHIPRHDSLQAPIELFSSTKFSSYDHLHRLHVFGCPVYVLDPRLQDGKKIPKWDPGSRGGQFLGFSSKHSSTIGNILNLRTGNISPQYHLVYDDEFPSVPNVESGGLLGNSPISIQDWNKIIASGLERYIDHDADPFLPIPSLHDDWLSPTELVQRQ